MRIKTKFDNPPIPVRELDWSAWDDETFDEYSIVGHGKTKQEAINDLVEQTYTETCNRCGDEYCDILGIGCCSKCLSSNQ